MLSPTWIQYVLHVTGDFSLERAFQDGKSQLEEFMGGRQCRLVVTHDEWVSITAYMYISPETVRCLKTHHEPGVIAGPPECLIVSLKALNGGMMSQFWNVSYFLQSVTQLQESYPGANWILLTAWRWKLAMFKVINWVI